MALFPIRSRALVAGGFGLLLVGWTVSLLAPGSRLGGELVRSSYDWSQSLVMGDFTNSPVVIVYLDMDSYQRERLDLERPWSRSLHAALLRRLTVAGAKGVIFDIIFDEASSNAAPDLEFARALRQNGHAVLAGELNRSNRSTPKTEGIELIELSRPAGMFRDAAGGWGAANLIPDSDFVVRRRFDRLADANVPSLDEAAAEVLGLPATNQNGAAWIRYYGRPLAIPHVSYSTALRSDEVGDDFFRDKVVFVGARPMTGRFMDRRDEFRSPFSAWGAQYLFMPAVEVHATQLINRIRGDSLRRPAAAWEIGLLGLTAVLSTLIWFRVRPLTGALLAVVAELGVLGIVGVALAAGRFWFPWLIVSAVQIPGALAASVLYQSVEWYRQKRLLEEQRRAAEQKIHEQAALIEKAQDAILVENMAGRIIYANSSAEKLYGWSVGELAAEGVARLIAAPARVRFHEARQAAVEKGEWFGELEQQARDGRGLMVSSRFTLIKDEHGAAKSLLFINTDVTEKKRLELEFFQAQRIESIGGLASGMAHDLNNALAPILMGLQLLQKQKLDEETQRMLGVMEENTHRGADMVRQVLLFSRGRNGERETLAPASLVDEMERILRQTFPKSISVAAMVPGDLWPIVGNATQLHQVLMNLCVNARDAMPGGGQLTLAADNVELAEEEARQIPNGVAGKFVMLIVSDTGSGIAPAIMARIFEPFFTTKPPGQGTGLGLSTTARIMSQHAGFMNVRSEPGAGTTFELYLPCAVNPGPAVAKHRVPPELRRGNGELLLVVDDEQSVREMVAIGLTSQGYRVVSAPNGAEAIDWLEKHPGEARLVLLDTDMPVLNGRATADFLRVRVPALPILLMSGEGGTIAGDDKDARLSKPFALEELLRAVARRLAGRRSE